jgi:iron-sulfur cluster assembly accessory protein
MSDQKFTITDSAAKRILELAAIEGGTPRFRVSVLGGGCSGFQYEYKMDNHIEKTDLVFKQGEAEVVIDDISLGFIEGSVLDYVETLGSSSFEIKNPNASARCGCGNSFSV